MQLTSRQLSDSLDGVVRTHDECTCPRNQVTLALQTELAALFLFGLNIYIIFISMAYLTYSLKIDGRSFGLALPVGQHKNPRFIDERLNLRHRFTRKILNTAKLLLFMNFSINLLKLLHLQYIFNPIHTQIF